MTTIASSRPVAVGDVFPVRMPRGKVGMARVTWVGKCEHGRCPFGDACVEYKSEEHPDNPQNQTAGRIAEAIASGIPTF